MRSWSVVEVKTESMRFLECFIYASTSFSSILFRVQSFYFVTNTWPMFLKLCLRRTNNDQLFLRVPRFFKTSISVIPYSSVFLSLLVKKKNVASCYLLRIEEGNIKEKQPTETNVPSVCTVCRCWHDCISSMYTCLSVTICQYVFEIRRIYTSCQFFLQQDQCPEVNIV